MTAKEFHEQLTNLLCGVLCDDEIAEFIDQIKRASTFQQAGLMTNNLGIQAELDEGETVHMEFLGTW